MSTVTNSASAALNQINQSSQEWNAQYEGLSQQQQDLIADISDEQTQIDDLTKQVNDDEAEVADLEDQLDNASDEDKPGIQDQIDALNEEIAESNQQISQLNQQKAANQTAYNALVPTLMTVSTVATDNSKDVQKQQRQKEQTAKNTSTEDSSQSMLMTSSAPEETTTDSTTTDDTVDDTDSTDNTDNTDSTTTDPTPQQLAAQTLAWINDQIAAIDIMTQQMWDDFNQIGKDQTQIAQDQQKIDELNDKIVEDSIKMAACAVASIWTCGLSLGGAAYFAVQVAKEKQERDDLQNQVSGLQNEVATLNAEINSLISQLSAVNSAVAMTQLQQVTAQVKSILSSLMSAINSGNVSEAQVQQAAIAIVAVMSQLQVLLAQVYKARSQDQQDMSKAGAQNYSTAANKSSIDLEKFTEAVQHQKFMKIVMDVAQVALATAGVIAAAATGGVGSIALAAGMAALTAVNLGTGHDYLGDAISDLGTAIADSSNGKISKEAGKVLADVIVAIVMAIAVMLTDGAASKLLVSRAASQGAAAGGAAARAAEEAAANTAAAIPMRTFGAEAGEEAGEELTREMADLTAQGVRRVGNAPTAASNGSSLVKFGGTTLMMTMMNNTLLDSFQAIVDSKMSKDEAQKKKWFKALQIILSVVQVVLGMLGGHIGAGGQATAKSVESRLQAIFAKIGANLADITLAGQGLQAFGNILSTIANAFQTKNAHKLADMYRDIGAQKSIMTFYQSTMDANKTNEKAYSDEAATQMQQLAATIQEMASKFCSGEREAARLIAHMAV